MTPQPKKKSSKRRTRNRHSAHKAKFSLPTLAKCSNCGELKYPHRACPNCGSIK